MTRPVPRSPLSSTFFLLVMVALLCTAGTVFLGWIASAQPAFFERFYLLIAGLYGLLIAVVVHKYVRGAVSEADWSDQSKNRIRLQGAAASFFLWILACYLFAPESAIFTVQVHLEGAVTDYPVENGKVWLNDGFKKVEEELNGSGMAVFQLPANLVGQSVKIGFSDAQGRYVPADKNTEYKIAARRTIFLPVKRNDALRWAEGQLIDNAGRGMPNATVRVGRQSGLTNHLGQFKIAIPDDEQTEYLPMSAEKDGHIIIREQKFKLSDRGGEYVAEKRTAEK